MAILRYVFNRRVIQIITLSENISWRKKTGFKKKISEALGSTPMNGLIRKQAFNRLL